MRWVLALLMVLGAAGCRGTDAGLPDTGGSTSVHTLTVDGRERSYRLYRPVTVREPAPLVVMLHGGFGSGEQAESAYGWNTLADREHVLVAYPDSLGQAWSVGGGCCGEPGRTGVDDTAFVTAMVTAIGRETPLERRRVYATGMSNGGMLAYRLACDTTVFAAIGPVATTMLGACPSAAPVSVIHLHGTADERVRYDGEPGEGIGRIDGPPVPDVLADWRRVGDCPPPVVSMDGPVTRSTAGCPQGRAVELITVEGVGHQWPMPTTVEQRVSAAPLSGAVNATEEIWRFFAAHPARRLPDR